MQVTQAIVTALVVQVVAGDAKSALYEPIPLTNVIFSTNLLFESRAWTKGQCSLLCLNYGGCVTFTYTAAADSNSSGTCRGHSNRHYCWDTQTARANTQYYGVPNLARQNKAGNCKVMQTLQPGSGVRQLCDARNSLPVSAYCDQDNDGGGWTVIQRRQDGSVNFNETWAQYQAGFGDLTGEHWLGLETIYKMTSSQTYEIRFDLQIYAVTTGDGVYEGTTGYTVHNSFSVGPGSDDYRLYVGSRTAGNLDNYFPSNNGYRFSTWDRDNDVQGGNCAAEYGGGWWYSNCGCVYLNSPFRYIPSCPYNCNICPNWCNFRSQCSNAVQKATIKIRPLSP